LGETGVYQKSLGSPLLVNRGLKTMSIFEPIKRILALTRKEIQTIIKDRTAMLLVFLLPIITIGALALAIQQNDIQAETVPLFMGVVDLDTTDTYPGLDLSQNFTATLASLDGVTVVEYGNESDAYEALFYAEVDAYVVIPDGFEHALSMNLPTIVNVHTSNTQLQGQGDTIIAVTQATLIFRERLGWIRSDILTIPQVEFVPEGDSLAIQVGAFLVVFCIFMAIALISCQSIVGDIPLRRMLLTPTSKVEVVFGKIAAYSIIGMIQGVLLLVLWIVGFQLNLRTDLLTLAIIVSLMALSGAVAGVVISSFSTSRLQANQGFLFLLLGMMILSGMFIDVGIISEFLPMNLGMELIRETAFKGLPLIAGWEQILRILLFIIGGTFIAILVLWRKRTLA
jgi:ABC-2 type transport system permease protein